MCVNQEYYNCFLNFGVFVWFWYQSGTGLTKRPFGIPEIIGCIVVTLLHIWKRNTLLSIGAGTVCYMLLVQFVF